ncbi:hypothetical protein RND81_01G100300 [Saponaria officinalis]|uniref:E3 ubiquitin-protein ligase RHG1A n=1 Tax=Saponaria officinalis TaxID=3572 RepID=A0AAW1NCY6_SAPOF
MQGQRSAVGGSLPDSINFDYGSPSTNVGLNPQICWNNHRNSAEGRLSDYRISARNSENSYMGNISQEGSNLGRWDVGEASSSSLQNPVGHDERLNQDEWSSPVAMPQSFGAGLRSVEQHFVPENLVSQPVVNLNLSANQNISGPSFVRGSSSNSASQNFDLNGEHFHRVGDDMDCRNSSKSIGFQSKYHPVAGSSPDPFASSGSGGFFVETDDGRNPGCSLDGRRPSCKRKSFEENVGQSSSAGNCSPRAEGNMWQENPPHIDAGSSMNVAATREITSNISLREQVNPRLRLGTGVRVSGDTIHPLNLPGGSESSRRNYRLRVNPSFEQDSTLNNSFSPVLTGVARHPDIPSVNQPLGFVPINPSLDLMSPIPPETSVIQNESVILRASTMRRNVQSHRRNNLRHAYSSLSSAVSRERNDVLPDDPSSRNQPRTIGEHPVFTPLVETRSSASHPTNWSLSGGSVEISRNTGSSSRSRSGGNSHSSGESGASHRHPPSQYSRRLSEYVRRSLLSTVGSDTIGQISTNSQHRSVPASPQDGILSSSGGDRGNNHSHSRSTLWMERQTDGAGRIPYLRALAVAGEGRSRIVSEIRNALDIIRRGEGLRIEVSCPMASV